MVGTTCVLCPANGTCDGTSGSLVMTCDSGYGGATSAICDVSCGNDCEACDATECTACKTGAFKFTAGALGCTACPTGEAAC